jgi:hypothetical protein
MDSSSSAGAGKGDWVRQARSKVVLKFYLTGVMTVKLAPDHCPDLKSWRRAPRGLLFLDKIVEDKQPVP